MLELVIKSTTTTTSHHHAWVRPKIIITWATIHAARWSLPAMHASTPLLRYITLQALTPLEVLLLVVLLSSVPAGHNADVVSLEWIFAMSITHSAWPAHNGLVHHDAVVWVFKSSDIF